MLISVREATGADISFADFLGQGTVASLAGEIERHREIRPAAGPIVALRKEGSKTPLVCIPGHDGILAGIAHLAQLLGDDQPAYALEAPQPAAFPGDAWNIPAFAAHYAEALVERFQKRPIHLAGICFGGVTAYELARQLEQRGAAVQSLILLDTLNPQWQEGCGALSRFAAQGEMVCERVKAHLKNLWDLRWRGTAEYLRERARALSAGHREAADLRRMRGSSASVPGETALLRRLAASNYRPGPYAGPIAMIRVRGLRPNPPWMGWRGIATGEVSIVGIDFYPRGMMAEPAVATLASLVSGVIG
jgi:thioesterase domain-containing protein